MMLHRISLAVLFASVFGLLLAAANAESKQLVATGKVVTTAFDTYGEITCVGGQPVAGLPPWDPLVCSPETTHVRVRGLVRHWVYYDLEGTGAKLLWGVRTTVENYNINPKTGVFTGWGTMEATIYECPYPYACANVIGTWDGSWTSGAFPQNPSSSASRPPCTGVAGLRAWR